MDFKKTVGILTLILLLVAIVGGLALVERRQRLTGKALTPSTPSPLPKVYFQEDYNKDGLINDLDLAIFKRKYDFGDLSADLDHSGDVNSLDYNLFLSKLTGSK